MAAIPNATTCEMLSQRVRFDVMTGLTNDYTNGSYIGIGRGGAQVVWRTGSRATALVAVRRAAVKRGARTEASYALQRCDVAFPRAPDLIWSEVRGWREGCGRGWNEHCPGCPLPTHKLQPGQCSFQPRQALATTGVIFDCRQPGGPGGCRAASVRQLNITHVVAGAESILHDSPERSEVILVRARSNSCPHVWPLSAERGAGGGGRELAEVSSYGESP